MAERHYPIVFIRGFAARRKDIEATAAEPFDGFNDGSTMMRQVGRDDFERYYFESPLLRLLSDHGYSVAFHKGEAVLPPVGDRREGFDPRRTVWIYQYYEAMSASLGNDEDGEIDRIPEIAEGLRRLILRIRDEVTGDDAAARDAFRVNLVAHSMGGLVARCYLQNLCVFGPRERSREAALELESRTVGPNGELEDSVHLVNKLFTYGTPHNGIDVKLLGNVPGFSTPFIIHSDNFNRERMRRYLAIPDDEPVNSLAGVFPLDRAFCLVGTNHRDYDIGASKFATDERGDGLVLIKNATIRGAPRAFVHRSHGGPLGLVNSESGYQNLRRFLFGRYRVDLRLRVDEVYHPPKVEQALLAGAEASGSVVVDTTVTVRGSRYVLHERRGEHQSAALCDLTGDRLQPESDSPVYLFTGYLLDDPGSRPAHRREIVFYAGLTFFVPRYKVDGPGWFDEWRIENEVMLARSVYFKLTPRSASAGGGFEAEYRFSDDRRPEGRPIAKARMGSSDETGVTTYAIPFGQKVGAEEPARPGLAATLLLDVREHV